MEKRLRCSRRGRRKNKFAQISPPDFTTFPAPFRSTIKDVSTHPDTHLPVRLAPEMSITRKRNPPYVQSSGPQRLKGVGAHSFPPKKSPLTLAAGPVMEDEEEGKRATLSLADK